MSRFTEHASVFDPTDDLVDTLDLDAAINQLDDQEHLVVALFYLLDLPEAVVAELLEHDLGPGVTRSTANTIRRRAVRCMRRYMETTAP